MTYSEKTQRQVSKYIVKLVRRQPAWLRDMFEREEICFCCEDDGSMVLAISESIEPRLRGTAQVLISKYMKQNPCKAIIMHEVN